MPVVNKHKDWFWMILNVVLVVLVLLGLGSIKTLYKYSQSLAPSRTIVISAEGKTTVIPDIATFTFSVVNEGKNPEDITAKNAGKINEAIDFVKAQGVDAKDIKTAGYDLSPRYEYDKDKRTTFISGYTLTQTIAAKIRDFSTIGKILGALPGMGINQVGGLSFQVDDQDKYLNVAREEAFGKARLKAKEMASYNKVRLGRVVTFVESQGGYYPIPIFRAFDKGGIAESSIAPSIEPGSQEVTVNVSVTYEIR